MCVEALAMKTEIDTSTNGDTSPLTPMHRPDLTKTPVLSNTIKGVGIGAVAGTVLLAAIDGFHLLRGERPVNKYTLNPLTGQEYWQDFVKSAGVIAGVSGAVSCADAISENRIKEKITPYVESLEIQRNKLLDEKSKCPGK